MATPNSLVFFAAGIVEPNINTGRKMSGARSSWAPAEEDIILNSLALSPRCLSNGRLAAISEIRCYLLAIGAVFG